MTDSPDCRASILMERFVGLPSCFGRIYKDGSINNLPYVQNIANAYGAGEFVIVGGTGPTEIAETGFGARDTPTIKGIYSAAIDPIALDGTTVGYVEESTGAPWTVVRPSN